MSSRKAQREEARAKREATLQEAAARERRRRRLWLLGGILAAAGTVVAVAIVVSSSAPKKLKAGVRPPQSAQVAAMFKAIPQRGQTLGKPNAPVTLVEFADLKCPVCRAYTAQALPKLVKDYVRPGKLKIIFQPQTFVGSPPGDSEHAARFALAAGIQNRMWQFAELWYDNQQDETTAYATDSYIRQIGSGVRGLNIDRAMKQRNSPQVSQALDAASSLFDRSGFNGTPSFLLGGNGQPLKPLSALVDPSQFTGPIDRLLKR
jgi:protein-disulfide isomerase